MIARGQGRRVPPLFAPAGSSARQIGPVPATAPGSGTRHRARGPPTKASIRIAMESRRWGAHNSVPDMLLGQRSDPASPAKPSSPY